MLIGIAAIFKQQFILLMEEIVYSFSELLMLVERRLQLFETHLHNFPASWALHLASSQASNNDLRIFLNISKRSHVGNIFTYISGGHFLHVGK